MTKSFVTRVLATAATAGAIVAVTAPAALAVADPQKCPYGSHGVVVTNPRDPNGSPLFLCVSTG